MRLLYAEDERALSDAVCVVLRHANYTVDAVYDGEDALEYLRTGVYDAAILDIMMPKMDGVDVLKTARSEGIQTPILLLTAKSEIDDRVTGLDAGADDYLTKPFAMKELLARVRVMTRRSTESLDNLLTFGNVTLDTLTYEMKTAQKSLRLANKEFQMFQMLMANPGQVISVDKFMDKIWGWDSDTEQNVVWVYISYLRRKLESIGADIRIKAVRNLGYTLDRNA
ncbi:MAG: response regulator transcription factor [Clostridia bacterium]|nr:response regulator transcription factor [Clostridia bacterium]MBR0509894.1 response regulator transcription factor [Clostridia bacterium]MBR0536539.1 response regulator transcription factor [Clostridia bacterium]